MLNETTDGYSVPVKMNSKFANHRGIARILFDVLDMENAFVAVLLVRFYFSGCVQTVQSDIEERLVYKINNIRSGIRRC